MENYLSCRHTILMCDVETPIFSWHTNESYTNNTSNKIDGNDRLNKAKAAFIIVYAPKIVIMCSDSAKHEMLRALLEVCCLVQRAVHCISNQYNTTAKNWRSSSSPSSSHSLQGFRPCDLFWFHRQCRQLLRCHLWLHSHMVDVS